MRTKQSVAKVLHIIKDLEDRPKAEKEPLVGLGISLYIWNKSVAYKPWKNEASIALIDLA